MSLSEEQSARSIDDEAAAWAVRIDAHGLDEDGDPQLAAWLAGDARRRGALLRARAALSLLDRGRALPQGETGRAPWLSRRNLILAGGAGAGLAAVWAGAAVFDAQPVRYGAALGEVRRAPLADGSVIALNTQSDVEVVMRARARDIRLLKGEAWFDVAKDADRPFTVEAGAARVRAVGTAFSVRRLAEGCEVLVSEGVVELWLEAHGGEAVQAAAGSRALLRPGAPPSVVRDQALVDRGLAWRDGQIILDGETLDEAAAQFNRYNLRKIIIGDARLGQERLVGLFRTNQPESFAAAVAATLGARVAISQQAIRLDAPV